MQNDSNVETPQAENDIYTAILTPHLNHPNFSSGSDYCKRCNYAHKKRKEPLVPRPLSDYERKFRQRWAVKQVAIILNMPSNAVLGA
ncbi:hypothetical protein MKL37_10845 [Acinetobacter sp. AOR11_HL]|uniref:hypothetical protein n=1 Tax=Acinetobacter sp. AOR11_HL TaxID=2919377 RepID=UPI0022EACA14|nr:hypothetical protein [Acinetobacter sp. AOR11_HL]MDA3550913.1 hypothetical protein [Acinetobacter sp. AOR11_HL]